MTVLFLSNLADFYFSLPLCLSVSVSLLLALCLSINICIFKNSCVSILIVCFYLKFTNIFFCDV